MEKIALEGPLCGALTLTFVSGLEYLNWPRSMAILIGGGVGFIGVDAIRAVAMKYLGNRFGVGGGNADKQ